MSALATHTESVECGLPTEEACAVPTGHRLADAVELRFDDRAAEPWVDATPTAWEPWHRAFTEQFTAAGFSSQVVQYPPACPSWPPASGLPVWFDRAEPPPYRSRIRRRCKPIHHNRDCGLPTNSNPTLARLIDMVTALGPTSDMTTTG